MRDADEDVEARFGVSVIVLSEDVQSGAGARINVPSIFRSEHVGEFDVECGDRGVVAKADFKVWSKVEPVDDGWRLDMYAEIELFRLDGDARTQTNGLGSSWKSQYQQHECCAADMAPASDSDCQSNRPFIFQL